MNMLTEKGFKKQVFVPLLAPALIKKKEILSSRARARDTGNTQLLQQLFNAPTIRWRMAPTVISAELWHTEHCYRTSCC